MQLALPPPSIIVVKLPDPGQVSLTQGRSPHPVTKVRPEEGLAALSAQVQHLGQGGAEPQPGKMTQSPEHHWGKGRGHLDGSARCGWEEGVVLSRAVRALKAIVCGRLRDSHVQETPHTGRGAIRGYSRASWWGGCEAGEEGGLGKALLRQE